MSMFDCYEIMFPDYVREIRHLKFIISNSSAKRIEPLLKVYECLSQGPLLVENGMEHFINVVLYDKVCKLVMCETCENGVCKIMDGLKTDRDKWNKQIEDYKEEKIAEGQKLNEEYLEKTDYAHFASLREDKSWKGKDQEE